MIFPYQTQKFSKKKQVELMFNKIACEYDFLNHVLSLGMDKYWRRKVVAVLKNFSSQEILDVATGTGDLAISVNAISPQKIVGIDISTEMLEKGREKISKKNLSHKISLLQGDSENLPFKNESFDTVISAFGVRNFENLSVGLQEMFRVLKKNGRIVILEFSKPQVFGVKHIYSFYFSKILPRIAKIFSKDKFAYDYLPASVSKFPFGKDFLNEISNAGFENTFFKPLTFGIVSIYVGEKI